MKSDILLEVVAYLRGLLKTDMSVIYLLEL